jgi:hypothetical protein
MMPDPPSSRPMPTHSWHQATKQRKMLMRMDSQAVLVSAWLRLQPRNTQYEVIVRQEPYHRGCRGRLVNEGSGCLTFFHLSLGIQR